MFYEFEKEEKREKCEEANDLCLWKCSMWKRKGVCVKVEGVVSTTVGKTGVHHFGHISSTVAPKIIKQIGPETTAHKLRRMCSNFFLNRSGSIFKKISKMMCLFFPPPSLPKGSHLLESLEPSKAMLTRASHGP